MKKRPHSPHPNTGKLVFNNKVNSHLPTGWYIINPDQANPLTVHGFFSTPQPTATTTPSAEKYDFLCNR